ncbi:hypothetical protein [Streptomyces sp. NPDC127072]
MRGQSLQQGSVAGDDGSDDGGCLPGNKALMTLDAVAAVHRLRVDS